MKNMFSCWCWFVLISIFLATSNIDAKKAEKSNAKAFNYEIACGISNGNEIFEEDKIVGGEVAQPHEFPWMISLQIRINGAYQHNCGAAVIHSQFALTAGHCVTEAPINEMRLAAGKFNLKETESTEQYRDIKSVNIGSYDKDSFKHDIALIQVTKPFDLNQQAVAPICLPTGSEHFYDKGILAGWGRLEEDGSAPDKLMKVMLPLIDTNRCKQIFINKNPKYDYYLHDCQICTFDENEKDGCQGDSGGPLMCGNKDDNKLYVCGIVSLGIGCARRFPGLYTEVSCFTEWITDEIEKNKY